MYFECLNDKLYQNDIEYLINTLISNEDQQLYRAVGKKNVFFKPNSTVTIRLEVDKNTNVTLLNNVKNVLEKYAFPYINLNFEFVDDSITVPNIRIILNSNNNFSGGATKGIGTEFSIINLYSTNKGNILHELAHALGRYHEHMNPNDNPLEFIKSKVYDFF